MLRAYSGTCIENFLAGFDSVSGLYDKRKVPKSIHSEVCVVASKMLDADDLPNLAYAKQWAKGNLSLPEDQLIVLSGLVRETSFWQYKLPVQDNIRLESSRFALDRVYTFDGYIRRVDDVPAFYSSLMQGYKAAMQVVGLLPKF